MKVVNKFTSCRPIHDQQVTCYLYSHYNETSYKKIFSFFLQHLEIFVQAN